MAWKFRKRIKIAPGLTINVSRSGISTTIGPKGANINIGKNGTYLNTGIPGTGIYDRKRINTLSFNRTTNHDTSGCFWFLGILIIVMIITSIINVSQDMAIYFIGIIIAFILWLFVLALKTSNNKINNSNCSTEKDSVSIELVGASSERQSNMFLLSWKKDNFDLLQTEVVELFNFLKSATRNTIVRKELDKILAITNSDGSPWDLNDKITMAMLLDAYRCYTGLGYEIDAKQDEELGLLLFANQVTNSGFNLDYFKLLEYREKVVPSTRIVLDNVITLNEQCSLPNGQFFFQHIFENVDKERMSQYMVLLYRYASAIAKADDTISEEESSWLASLLKAKELTTDGKPLFDQIKPTFQDTTISGNDELLEVVAKDLLVNQTTSISYIQRKFSIGYNRASKILNQLERLKILGPKEGNNSRELWCSSEDELTALLSSSNSCNETIQGNALKELHSLIGLSSVKEEIEKLTSFIKIMNIRESEGLPISDISYHCVFTGNPGTGKTTVARIIANIYKELGIIKQGHLVETDRSGLVAEYVGQTAVKTNKIIDSALDGVLFIDEAYSLVNGSSNDYGLEAISTLLKRMEDDRKRLVVILAGYSIEMKKFINSNPGLQSRFNRYIEFTDYDSIELLDIYKQYLDKHKYSIEADAENAIKMLLTNAVANKDKNFGNARFVRNLFEETLENQAMRLAGIGKLSKEMLCTITLEDIPSTEGKVTK